MIKIGTIIWRPVYQGRVLEVVPKINGDFGYRIDFDSCIEPQLISGSEKGLVAVTKRAPHPDWTHAVVIGMSKEKSLVFIRFGYDTNVGAYLQFRHVLAERLEKEEPSECVVYENMENGFRRINEPCMEVMYV